MLGIYGEVRVHQLRSPWHVCCHALRRGLLWRVNISNWRSCLWKMWEKGKTVDMSETQSWTRAEKNIRMQNVTMQKCVGKAFCYFICANLPYLPFIECTITNQTDLKWIMRSHLKETPSILHIGFSLVVMRTTPQPAIASSVALEESFPSLKKIPHTWLSNWRFLQKACVGSERGR